MDPKSTDYYEDVQKCVDDAIEKVGYKIILGLPLGLGKANITANEFFRRARNDPAIKLKIITALTLERPTWSSELEKRFLEPFLERVFGDYPDLEYILALRKGALPPNIEISEFFIKPGGFIGNPHIQMNYISTNYTFAPRDIVDTGVNVMAQMVSKKTIEDRSSYSLSCNPEVSMDVMDRLQKMDKDRKVVVIGEVNRNLPYMYGDAEVEPSMFDYILDNPNYYKTLFGAPKMPVSTQDYHIGLYAGALIKDGGTLQIGIGSLGDALVYGLQQRHLKNETYKQIMVKSKVLEKFAPIINTLGGLDPFEKGLYGSTEMLVDGYLHLFQSGIIKRKVYDHAGLQTLVNADQIKEEITPDIIDLLIQENVIQARLTRRNFKFMQKFGIIKPEWNYEKDWLIQGDTRISADLSDPGQRELFVGSCLGNKLRHGVVIHAGFFLGPQSFYTALKTMTDEERKQIYMTSVLFVNQLYGGVYGNEELKLLQRKDARFVNAALMFTMLGGVVSDGLENGQVVSGVGGQYNFVSQAHALPGGRSILMAKSIRVKGKEVSSNIVWKYGHITIPRHLRDIVITEYGIAALRGKSDQEVIAAILNITDSRFQEELLAQAKSNGKIMPNYKIPDLFKNNLPARLEDDLALWRKQGLFPKFPFGTDFTKEELILGKTLKTLKETMQSKKFSMPNLSDARKIISVPHKAKPFLERLKLDHPKNGKEIMMQKLVLYALSSQNVI